jgi:hypothetical protein
MAERHFPLSLTFTHDVFRKPASIFRDHALLLLGRGAAPGGRPARIVPIRHALLDESIARRALQSLVVRAEFAGCHFLLCIDRET